MVHLAFIKYKTTEALSSRRVCRLEECTVSTHRQASLRVVIRLFEKNLRSPDILISK